MSDTSALPDLARLAPDQRRGGVRSVLTRIGELTVFWYFAAIVLVIVVWQLVVLVTSTPDYLLPTPSQVWDALTTFHSTLIEEGWVTLREILIAFGVSVALGVAIAIPIAFVRTVERISYPLLVMSQAVPKIAVGPLFIVWFGFGLKTNVLIAVSVAIFPVIVNTALGLTSIDPSVVRLGRSMGASRWRLFWLLRIPTALPSIFAGLKVAITLATIGAVVGEFIVGGSGLGYLTVSASGNQNVALLFACVICLAVIGIAVFAAVDVLERLVLRRHGGLMRT
jgi:NitT/TauT family transport system permease protein